MQIELSNYVQFISFQDIDQHDAVTQESELNQGDTHFIDYLPTDFEQKLAIDINQAND